ncbi:type II toxin-antitoxin system VapC family toxin [Dyadobacter sp. CY345]|uniref:type II toxin-antitoxin system VapC family toxin n=1 Tax=Dyadobacter sp. CY345 TaxID=2909335 RepID=UPI001F3A0DB2|nr:type II toxin-antitoxin system VapC family toxin [Dyadobacter sp. CY345]MCF2444755.1 type II toxin-antitoxin system VapC family toxin [Dyadobacter sp. CY345]
MGKSGYLIDTNSVIDFLNNNLPDSGSQFLSKVVDDVPIISVISKMEVLGYNTPEKSYQTLLDFIDDSFVIGLTEEVIDMTINLRKINRIKLPDAIIAATALVYDYTLISRNISDFKNVSGLELLNPHEL